jgi:hypothetical protein
LAFRQNSISKLTEQVLVMLDTPATIDKKQLDELNIKLDLK